MLMVRPVTRFVQPIRFATIVSRTRSLLARLAFFPLAFAICLAPTTAMSLEETASPPTGAWEFLRTQFYGDREIGVVDEEFMRLEAPANTPDPAATPLTLHFGKGAVGNIKQVRLIIDNNPSPLSAHITFGPRADTRSIKLRVRVDEYTLMHAVAETQDGQLYLSEDGGESWNKLKREFGEIRALMVRPLAD